MWAENSTRLLSSKKKGNLEPPINLMCMLLSCGRKTGENQPRSIKEAQTGAGMELTERLAGMPVFYLIQFRARVVYIIHKGCKADPLFNPIKLPTLHFTEALASH